MEKLQLDIPLILPDAFSEQDFCVQRTIDWLSGRPGIDKVHIRRNGEPGHEQQLCIHFDLQVISLERVRQITEQAGVEVGEKYGHLLLNVKGIRHARHARWIQEKIANVNGVLSAELSAAGTLRVEYEHSLTDAGQLRRAISALDTEVKVNQPVAVAHYHPSGAHDHPHEHEQHDHDHDHEHGGVFGPRTELIFSIICGAALAVGFVLSLISGIPSDISLAAYLIAYFFGGFYTTKEAYNNLRRGVFEIDTLMLVAAIGSAALGGWAEGALLLFLFSLGHALEHYAMQRARKSIAALADLTPDVALVRRNGETVEVKLEALNIGDVIVVKPNTKIAADGVVIAGESAVNQAPITGESVPVDKLPIDNPDREFSNLNNIPAAHRVFAGTINGSHVLEVKVLKTAEDSTLARLITLVREAETQKSPTQRFTDRFERYYVPAVLIGVGLLCLAFLVIDEPFSSSFYRAMAVLVAASPCALAISTPSAVLSGVARAARGGVLIKGGRPLEDLGSLTAIAFDKTGTLTEGKPKLTKVIPYETTSREELLTVAAAVESLSDHPLAAAIVAGAREELKDNEFAEAENLSAITARGVRATYQGDLVHIGNRALMEDITQQPVPEALNKEMERLEAEGHTSMLIHRADRYLGLIAVMDVARPEAKSVLERLRKLGIERMIMLTGDNDRVAEAVGRQLGITDPMGDLLPEDKVNAIKRLKSEEAKVAMVGDGVNDAPAMANSTVGIAMGAAGSDVALETADIALMADRLDNLPFAIGLSRQARRIIVQNVWISLGMIAVLVPLTLAGIADIGPAVIGHEGSTLVVVANALRLLGYKE